MKLCLWLWPNVDACSLGTTWFACCEHWEPLVMIQAVLFLHCISILSKKTKLAFLDAWNYNSPISASHMSIEKRIVYKRYQLIHREIHINFARS
jgi:hypothetical protein